STNGNLDLHHNRGLSLRRLWIRRVWLFLRPIRGRVWRGWRVWGGRCFSRAWRAAIRLLRQSVLRPVLLLLYSDCHISLQGSDVRERSGRVVPVFGHALPVNGILLTPSF